MIWPMGVGDEGRLESQAVETGARAPRTQALTSSNKQRDTEQTADTKHPPSQPRCFNVAAALTQITAVYFPPGGPRAEDRRAHQTLEKDELEEGAPLQFVILDRTPSSPKTNKQVVGIGFEVVRGRVIHDITGIGSTS